MIGGAPSGEVGEDFADDGGELEAMAGEAGGEVDVFVVGVGVDDEVLIGGIGVEADFVGEERAVGVGEAAEEDVADDVGVAGAGEAFDCVGGGDLAGLVVGDFEAGGIVLVVEDGWAVDEAFGFGGHAPGGEVADVELLGIFALEPEHDLTGDGNFSGELGHELRHPGAGGEEEVVGGVGFFFGADGDFVVGGRPLEGGLAGAEVGAVATGGVGVGGDGFFGLEETGVAFVEGDEFLAELELGERA